LGLELSTATETSRLRTGWGVAAAQLGDFYSWAFEAAARELLPRLYPVRKVIRRWCL